jgi:small multidrug resistance pump
MLHYLYLCVAIGAEVIGTSALKASDGFTKPLPSVVTALGYAVAFYCLALTLRAVPIGIAYAIWSGVGIVLVSLVAFFVYGQRLDPAAVLGMAFIIVGVVLMNAFSKAAVH